MGTRISLVKQLAREPKVFHKKQELMSRWITNAAECNTCGQEMGTIQRIDTPEEMKKMNRRRLRFKRIYRVDACRECEIENWWEKLKESGIVK